MEKKDYIVIPCDIYRRGAIVFFGDKKRLIEILKEEDSEDFIETVYQCATEDVLQDSKAITIPFDTGDVCIYAESKPDIPTIVHETAHAAQKIMKKVGADLSDEEAFAYLQEYIFAQVYEWITSSCDAQSQ